MGAKQKVFSADGDQPHKRDLKNLDRYRPIPQEKDGDIIAKLMRLSREKCKRGDLMRGSFH